MLQQGQQEKFDMETNENMLMITGEKRDQLKTLLSGLASFDPAALVNHDWVMGGIDDIALFGSDANNLASAMHLFNVHNFYVARTDEILSQGLQVIAYSFEASGAGIELFQSPQWFDLNVNDCLIFSIPLQFAVIRTAGVEYTLYAGEWRFLELALGRCPSS